MDIQWLDRSSQKEFDFWWHRRLHHERLAIEEGVLAALDSQGLLDLFEIKSIAGYENSPTWVSFAAPTVGTILEGLRCMEPAALEIGQSPPWRMGRMHVRRGQITTFEPSQLISERGRAKYEWLPVAPFTVRVEPDDTHTIWWSMVGDQWLRITFEANERLIASGAKTVNRGHGTTQYYWTDPTMTMPAFSIPESVQ